MTQTLVTIATDGFRNYVEMPDGRNLNLGSVSVLKLVTSLVRSSKECRGILDSFLGSGKAVAKVDLGRLEEMLKPKRARWAAKAFMSGVSKQGHMDKTADSSIKRELFTFMRNEGELLRMKESILKRILHRPHYDHNYAKSLWADWVDSAVDLYSVDLDEDGEVLFPVSMRDAMVREIADRERDLIERGDYLFRSAGEAFKGEVMSKLAGVSGDSESVAKQTGVENPYAGKDLSDNSTYYKLAASELPLVNEGLVHLVAAKVQDALNVVEATQKKGSDVAKSDLHIIAKKLDGLVKSASMKDPNVRPVLVDLARKADKVRAFFA